MFRKVKRKVKQLLKYFGLFKDKDAWRKASKNQLKYFKENVNIKSSLDTINEIRNTIDNKQKGAYLRFGDGDIYLMLSRNELLQKASKEMTTEMKEAMMLNVGSLHKGIPIHSKLFGFEEGMKENMHLLSDSDAIKYLTVTYKYLDIKNIYTPVALHYLATFNKEICVNFLYFLRNTNPVFVGNHKIKIDLLNKLFGDIHIKTPSDNSYMEIDRIEDELIAVLKNSEDKFKVVVVAMGCAGRILQKRILKKGFNVYLFDFGSLLDAFNNENTRFWIDLAGGTDNLKNILNKLD